MTWCIRLLGQWLLCMYVLWLYMRQYLCTTCQFVLTKRESFCGHLYLQNTLRCDTSATQGNFMQTTVPVEAGKPACDHCFVRSCDFHFLQRINKFASKTFKNSCLLLPNAKKSHLFTHINTSHSGMHHAHPCPTGPSPLKTAAGRSEVQSISAGPAQRHGRVPLRKYRDPTSWSQHAGRRAAWNLRIWDPKNPGGQAQGMTPLIESPDHYNSGGKNPEVYKKQIIGSRCCRLIIIMEVCVASECQERLQHRDTLLIGITVHTCITNREKTSRAITTSSSQQTAIIWQKGSRWIWWLSTTMLDWLVRRRNMEQLWAMNMSHSSMSKMSKLCRFVDSISLLPAFYLLLFATRQRLNGPEPVKERSANGNLNKCPL